MNLLTFILKCGVFFCFFAAYSYAESDHATFSIRLKQAPLVTTLQQLALEQNANLIINDELTGTLSLQLENTTLDQLFQAVAKIKNLSLLKEKGIYYLTQESIPQDNALNNLPIMAEFDSVPTIQPLHTTTLKLHFAKASEVMKSLTTGNGSLLSGEGSISFDDRSNVLIVKDNALSIKNIRKLVKELDKPIEQIAIEARIVTITDESLQELGVRWGLFDPTSSSHKVAGSLAANGFNNITDNLNVNFGAVNTPAGSLALQVAKINGRLLDLELTALERENNVKIIASPKLLTTNKKSASIKQGTEIPYVSTNEKSGSQNVEFREAVLGLEVTPHISQDNAILLDLIVSQNSPGASVQSGEGEVITIDKQEINTQVFAKDGETIVLGGVFQDTLSKGVDKVPVLGDIPVIKHLFRKQNDKHQKRELVIFVTPHILKQGQSLQDVQKNRQKDNKITENNAKLIE
ncbi:type IV pilus secretin PilQ [Lonepinella koalarum]|uniref:Protein transport protein HofQ n=1 Tax=Lonepinella koalarum TaxID=53417 RepID=A0A4R1KYA0_9PAST|nr:type IV pilus secretin PilQ [Lonepinella koalarum]MDH2926524.1 secretin [Lonepinella koalarum]TCK69540.1 protein transport protein HofQ [Lonepinella koalarum]TFJ89785.1 type IV pilus secretin PilQ [Lonepinella koalarum]